MTKNTKEQKFFNVTFGKCLKKYRISNGMTQYELADEVGVCQSLIQYWESGKRNIDFYLAVKVCAVLGRDIREFINDFAYYSML